MNDDDLEFNSDRFEQVRNARNSETAEDYTEMIADLIRNTGEARAVDLAKHFGVTGPTVNSIIRRLVRDGLVVSKPYRSIFLTGPMLRATRTAFSGRDSSWDRPWPVRMRKRRFDRSSRSCRRSRR